MKDLSEDCVWPCVANKKHRIVNKNFMVQGLEFYGCTIFYHSLISKKKGLLKQAFDVSEVNRNESITNDYQAVYQNEQNNQWRKVVSDTPCTNQFLQKQEMILFKDG